ncbi:MAG: GNAT family N-acetyltransferase [Tannerella sp.]|jgi:phosphinothricin acetyltransferase|nr:GNAT family N-acetyltransferase [Tannerella sp.]
MLRKVTVNDACSIAHIYNHYVKNTDITFEIEPVTDSEMRQRILDISARYPYIVCEESGRIAGYSYASLWKKREAYHHTVESTVYLHPSFQGKGIGTLLMHELLNELKKIQIHAVVACITLPNPDSIKLHEKLGFRQVSVFREVGYKFGRWLDITDWELLLT